MLNLKQNIYKLRHSVFVKNVLIIMTGTGIAQIIGFALSPVISRLFSPSDFGVFGSFSAVTHVISAGVTLQYSQAIMLPREKEGAAHLFVVSCLSTLAITILLTGVCLIIPSLINGLMKTKGMWALVLLVTAGFVYGLNQSFHAWCVRSKAFKQTSVSQVIRSIASNSAQIAFGFFAFGAPGLIISTVLADIVASINLIRIMIPEFYEFRRTIRMSRVKQLAREYIDFPLYQASQNVINSISTGLPVLLMGYYFGISVAGAYAFGGRILRTPMAFLLTALRQVLFQKAAETQHQGRSLWALYVKTTLGLFALGLLPTLVLFTCAPQLFAWLFGERWFSAGEYASYLVLWMLFVFCNLPAVLFARLIRIQRTVFFYDLILLAVRLAIMVIGGMFLSALATVILISVVGAAMNLILILVVGYAVMKKEGTVNFGRFRDGLSQ